MIAPNLQDGRRKIGLKRCMALSEVVDLMSPPHFSSENGTPVRDRLRGTKEPVATTLRRGCDIFLKQQQVEKPGGELGGAAHWTDVQKDRSEGEQKKTQERGKNIPVPTAFSLGRNKSARDGKEKLGKSSSQFGRLIRRM